MHLLELKIPPAAVALVSAALMWVLAHYVPQAAFTLPWQEIVSMLCVAAGLVFGIAGVLEFRRARTTVHPQQPHKATSLVRSGIYRYSRNPMYAGIFFILTGWALYLGNILSVLVLPMFVAYMNYFQIMVEERALVVIFGAGYTDYTRTVRRWL